MNLNVLMVIIFAVLIVLTYKPRRSRRQAEYPRYIHPVQETYRAPPPVEPQEFTEEDRAALTRRMTAEDTETLTFFQALNANEEPDSAEITDLRNFNIRQGWRPRSDTASPTLTGTIVEEVPEEDSWQQDEAIAEEWYSSELNLEEPDLLRDGVDITIRKLALKYFSSVPELEAASA